MTQHPGTPPPKSDKQNQHFIPRWWLKAFADTAGNIWARQSGKVRVAAAGDIMSEDWIYTLFDAWWRPCDVIEDNLSKIEGRASRLFRDIEDNGPTGQNDWSALLWFIALTACRHPRAMERGGELSRELSVFLQDIREFPDADSFDIAYRAKFGGPPDASMYPILSQLPQEAIEGTIVYILGLQPYDPQLPQTDALLATDDVAGAIEQMDCRLLEAPAGAFFVLGDRPLPATNMNQGFTIPLSKSLALEARTRAGQRVLRSSGVATATEVAMSNVWQATHADKVVIGPDRDALGQLPKP